MPTRTKSQRSQPKTLAKYRDMLRKHEPWSQRNILGIRTFLRRDMLDEPGRKELLQEFLAAAGRGEVRTDTLHHAMAIDYIRAKSLDGLGRLREGSRFDSTQLLYIEAATHHLLVGLLPNARHPERWVPVYRAVGPLGAVTYVGAKYERIKVLGFESSAPTAAAQPAARAAALAASKAQGRRTAKRA